MKKIEIVHSQSHLLFPKIMLTVFVLLGLVLIIQRYRRQKKNDENLLDSNKTKFFEENFDMIKFFGTLIALALFPITIKYLGFILSGFISLSILNVIYNSTETKKEIFKSIIISLIETLVVWYLFSNIFGIYLP